MNSESYDSVWDVVTETRAEAEDMKLRSALMMEIKAYIKGQNWSQAEAAAHLGIAQTAVAELMGGKIGLFSLDTLRSMVTRSEHSPNKLSK